MDEILALVMARRAEAEYYCLSKEQYADKYPDATTRLDIVLGVYHECFKDHLRHVYEVRGIDGVIAELYQ